LSKPLSPNRIQSGWEFAQIKPSRVRLYADLWPQTNRTISAEFRRAEKINTQILRLRLPDSLMVWTAAAAIPLLLLAPALWNGYPLLQYDTGGYLARWYEGYLVPSRSTVFGLYLHFGQFSYFWINLGIQALAAFWILQLALRVLGILTPFRLAAVGLTLILTTALPWLASMLLTDIFAGLSVLSLFVLVLHSDKISLPEKWLLFAFTSFAGATHSATLGVLFGLCCCAWIVTPFLKARIPLTGLVAGSLTLVVAATMLLSANFILSKQVAWTPGGVGVAFGRMLQDGIVTRYLKDHCPQLKLKLCPYRDSLPPTADDFLWGRSMFNTLGRFQGMNDEMAFIALHSLADYPAWQARAALTATAQQLTQVATGEGTNGWIPHTYAIVERYLPAQVRAMRAAHQQHWDIDFASINLVHVPVALVSMLLVLVFAAHGMRRRPPPDDLTLLAATVAVALLGNAVLCGVLSGPHDRYGARMVWIATFVVLAAAMRRFDNNGSHEASRRL